MRKALVNLIAFGMLCAVGQGNDKAKVGETITGCLNKGAQAGEFILTDEKSGQQIMVTGSSDLDKHAVNHKVKLSGSRELGDRKHVFKVSNLEHVSDTCTPGK